MTNSVLLKEAIKNSGLKMNFIAEKLGISRESLNRKVNNKVSFNQHELGNLCKILDINTSEQMNEIFFAGM